MKAAAERRQNEVKALGRVAAMVQTYEGEHKDVDPLRQMSRMIFTSAAVERSLYQILDERGEFIEYVDYGNAGGSRREPSAEMKLWNEERDRLTKYCKAAIDAKMTDRQTALLKEDAEVVVNVFEAVFVDLRLDDATRQRARLSAQKHLLQVAANG